MIKCDKHNCSRGLALAEQLCSEKGEKLTPLRREILEIVMAHEVPVKAYDIIEHLREKGKRVTPASVYRTLDFLLKYGLAHRVNSLNAYISCSGEHSEGTLLMLVCPVCQKTEEIYDDILSLGIKSRLNELGKSIDESNIEIQSPCSQCRPQKEISTA